MKYLLVFPLALLCLFSTAQSSEHYVIAAQGNSEKAATISLDWTIGDLVTQTVTSNKEILTQGFHQPILLVKEIIIHRSSDLAVLRGKVYPNPFVNELILDIENQGQEYNMELFDMSGKTIWRQKSSLSKQSIDLSKLQSAQYFLHVQLNANTQIKIFEIIKA